MDMGKSFTVQDDIGIQMEKEKLANNKDRFKPVSMVMGTFLIYL